MYTLVEAGDRPVHDMDSVDVSSFHVVLDEHGHPIAYFDMHDDAALFLAAVNKRDE